jgi:glycosyltransferase involved in cell wall biosynthesis
MLFPCFDNGTDINSLSGTPSFLHEAIKAQGLDIQPVSIPNPKKMYLTSSMWRVGRILQAKGIRGFTMSNMCLNATWNDEHKFPDGCTILSMFPVMSTKIIERAEQGKIKLSYYIDIPYQEFCSSYAEGKASDTGLARRSFALEQRGYKAATHIICFAKSSAKYIISTYNIDPDKVFVLRPGANLYENDIDSQSIINNGSSFVIGFVGMDWNRKGLPAIASAVQSLRQDGTDIKLMIAGDAPESIAKMDGVTFVGRINKATEMHRYIEFLAKCDAGVLLSKAEGLPMSLLEFLRMGKPVIGSDVNGIPDIVTPDVGKLLPKNAGQDQIKATLKTFAIRGDYWSHLSKSVQSRKTSYSWNDTARGLGAILAA